MPFFANPYEQADAVQQQRQVVMSAAYQVYPARLVKGTPSAVYINPPTSEVKLL